MASPTSVLLGRNSAISGTGFGTGYLRTWTVTQTLETIDVSGVGDSATLSGTAIPVRYRAVAFGDFTGSATGMLGGGGSAPTIGDSISITADAMTGGGDAVVTEVSEDGSYDGLVELSVSFESSGS